MNLAAALIVDRNGSVRLCPIYAADIRNVRGVHQLATKGESRYGRAQARKVRARPEVDILSAAWNVRAVSADDGHGCSGGVAQKGVAK